jgi:hypothetical protein
MVLGVPLDEMMWGQCKRNPALRVPAVMIRLEKAIEQLGGFHTRDAFRTPSDAGSVARLDMANEGKAEFHFFKCIISTTVGCKPFLVFSEDLAHRALKRVESLDFVVEIELLHWTVLKHLIGFLRHTAGYVEERSMDAVARAMDFGRIVILNEIGANPRPIKMKSVS